nr:ribonuclease H-like domain-containing protein [Tanacetum cinerariifolium]
MKYFFGIEVLDNANGICMNERKYCLDLIHEFGLLAAKPVTTPLPENCVLAVDESESDKSSLLLLLILKDSFCQVVEVADGLMEWPEVMLGFIHIRP